MAIFFKQSDGRLPRTVFYNIFKDHFKLYKKDLYFLDNLVREFSNDISKYAQIQLLAYQACMEGDPAMPALYDRAGQELAALVRAVIGQLDFTPNQPVRVSYSGGMFRAGDLIMKPFKRYLDELSVTLVDPQYPPGIGALALGARELLGPDALAGMLAAVSKDLRLT